jgi:hypothetical protein
MKPRRTLLVVINKKVEWGILSVADIAVKWVNFRLHRRAARGGRSWPPATRWPRRWIICRSRWTKLPSIWPPRAPASASPVICACWANPILLDQLSPSALRLPRADGVLTGQRIFVDFAVPHDNAKISVGFFEGPDVFQGIAIGESAKQRDQGRFTKHNAPHPCTCQNAGCAQHWRSAVALDDNPARNRPIAIVTFKPAN